MAGQNPPRNTRGANSADIRVSGISTGETDDTTIADFTVAMGVGQIKKPSSSCC